MSIVILCMCVCVCVSGDVKELGNCVVLEGGRKEGRKEKKRVFEEGGYRKKKIYIYIYIYRIIDRPPNRDLFIIIFFGG